MKTNRLSAIALLLLSAACDDGGDQRTDAPHDVADTGVDATPDVEADASDVGTDAADAAACTPPPELVPDDVDPEQTRFALTMFHFNVEYVIGGLEYFDEEGNSVPFLRIPGNRGWDNAAVEDYIIRETLRPILDLYAEHPDWRVTIELQAYAIEIMAERHPETLELLRSLAQSGQVELVSFHYAAQLFLAYPAEDMERSLAETRAIFEEHCLPLSGVVFNQEGQSGEGRQRMLVEQGWSIGVQPVNLWRYVRDGETPWPYYESEGGILVVGPGGVDPESGIEVTWPFFDDGELRAVLGGANPYLAPAAPHDPARVAEYEAELRALADEGWKHTTITDYVHQLAGIGVTLPTAPPLLDGTWQPASTDSIHRWLGGRSQANVNDEQDNRIRAGNAVARMHVDATQVLVDAARDAGHSSDDWDREMHEIWRALWHAQVSDASGVNPWRGEVLWCLGLNEEAIARSEALRDELLGALGWQHVQLDLASREATSIDEIPTGEPPATTDPWFDVALRADGRTTEIEWFEAGGEDRARLEISFSVADECEGCDPKRIEAHFPFTGTTIAYSPGLIEDEVRAYDFSEFSWLLDEVYLPLPNGLISLGDDLWLIKHTRAVHIAARLSPSDEFVRFIDAAIWAETADHWVFDVFRGSAEDALAAANRINIDPVVFY